VGGGISGITAAHTLSKKGLKVTVLEYSDYIGGRIKSFDFLGNTLEEGANWITGLGKEEKINPVWKLAKAIDLKGTVGDQICGVGYEIAPCVTQEGEDISEEFAEKIKLIEKASDILEEKILADKQFTL
jgi:ribulose 1,5-bisphosphate synthetase/thiazole synthase